MRYHGILAPCASWRDWIVPGPATEPGVPQCDPPSSNSIESFPAGGEACGRGSESEESAEHRAGANEGARCDPPLGSAAESASRTPASTGTPATPPRRLRWAALLQRVFEVDALRCPGCGARMRLLAAIEDPVVARKILECLDLPARAPVRSQYSSSLKSFGFSSAPSTPIRGRYTRPTAIFRLVLHREFAQNPARHADAGHSRNFDPS